MSEFRFPLDAENKCQGCGLPFPSDQSFLSHNCEALRYVNLLKSNHQLDQQVTALRQSLGEEKATEIERETEQYEAESFTFDLECNLECQGCGKSLGDPITYEQHRCRSLTFIRTIRENTKLKRRKLALDGRLAQLQRQAEQKTKSAMSL